MLLGGSGRLESKGPTVRQIQQVGDGKNEEQETTDHERRKEARGGRVRDEKGYGRKNSTQGGRVQEEEEYKRRK
jgi:hypothetical protein